jgi:hypothetical protein
MLVILGRRGRRLRQEMPHLVGVEARCGLRRLDVTVSGHVALLSMNAPPVNALTRKRPPSTAELRIHWRLIEALQGLPGRGMRRHVMNSDNASSSSLACNAPDLLVQLVRETATSAQARKWRARHPPQDSHKL